MPALVAGIHVLVLRQNKTWMAVTSPAMTPLDAYWPRISIAAGATEILSLDTAPRPYSLAVSEILIPSFCSSASTRLSAGSGWATQPSMVFHLPSWIIAMRVT